MCGTELVTYILNTPTAFTSIQDNLACAPSEMGPHWLGSGGRWLVPPLKIWGHQQKCRRHFQVYCRHVRMAIGYWGMLPIDRLLVPPQDQEVPVTYANWSQLRVRDEIAAAACPLTAFVSAPPACPCCYLCPPATSAPQILPCCHLCYLSGSINLRVFFI